MARFMMGIIHHNFIYADNCFTGGEDMKLRVRSKHPDRALNDIRHAVLDRYAQIAQSGGCGCNPSCCNPATVDAAITSQALGYSAEDTNSAPAGSNMALGCGNPHLIAKLQPGETVLDLGSGGGFDCFLAAKQVGCSGHVIGVDMTVEMISKARANAETGGYPNVEFRLGEMENLPVADSVADVILSNCAINLSPDKSRVFAEMYRVLKSGGRLAIADIVATSKLPVTARNDATLYTGCIAGASLVSDIEDMLADAGFQQTRIVFNEESRSFIQEWVSDKVIADCVVSATIEAVKPGT